MKLTIEIELSDREIRMLQDNSIERVHKTAMSVARDCRPISEDKYTVYSDLKDLGPLANKLWSSARNAAFIKLSENKKV